MAEMSFGAEDDDPLREARAYNQSIYFMVSMPYLLLATVGFLIWRSYRAGQRQAALALAQSAEGADGPLPSADASPSLTAAARP
jgi:hypothetical protein